jgi:hypothetical protein
MFLRAEIESVEATENNIVPTGKRNPMKYMLLVYSPESSWTPEEWNQCVTTSMAISKELFTQNKLLSSAPLHPVVTGVTVRVRNGEPLVTAGPFAETIEQLGGFYLIDVEDLDDAIAIAGRLPAAKKGTVEIRPVYPLDGLPKEQLHLLHTKIEASTSAAPLKAFMFLCYDDEQWWLEAGEEAHRQAMQEAVALTHRLNANKMYISAAPLHPTSTATSVRIREGQRSITDGPFAETREVLGGYYLMLAKDHSEAVTIASQHSGARVGAVEVRQVFDLSQFA